MNMTSNNYYKVGGSLDRDAPSYGVRQADEDFYQALKAGEFCYVLNSRQMGKSSLRVRTVGRLAAEGIACSQIDITSIGSRGITASEWYWGVVRRLARSFKTSINLKTWWQERAEASPVDCLSQFIEEVLLVEVQSSIAIFIDEIDSILNLDFKDDFFALIRTCYNQRAENPEYRRLTFALLGVATPSDLIQDKSRTPFNIGRSIDLRGLQLHEAEPLAQGLQGKAEDAIAVLKSILDWTGGQPFLTQKICQFVQSEADWIPAGQEAERVRSLVQSRVIENWEGQDEPEHLRTIQNRVTREDERKGQLLGLYQQVLEKGAIPATESEEQIRLRLSGLVVKDQGQLKPHNRIYAAVFDRAWAERILAELRPYAEAISIWLKSNGQDESRLLRGNALEEAQQWAVGKHLSEQDVRFLRASEQAERRVMVEKNCILTEANQVLTEANQKAHKRLKMTALLLGLAVLVATGAGIWAKRTVGEAMARLEPIENKLKRREADFDDIWTFSEGWAALISGKHNEAFNILNGILKRNPQNSFVLISLGRIDFQQKKYLEAELKFREVIRMDAGNAYAWHALGNTLKVQKKLDEAIAAYHKAVELGIHNRFVTYKIMGDIFLEQRKLNEAITNYRKATELNPKYYDAYNGIGNALFGQNKLNEAVTAYSKAIEIDPKKPYAYAHLGRTLFKQSRLDEAVATYKKAIEIDPKNSYTYSHLGNVLLRQNKLDEAMDAYYKSIEIDPKYSPAYVGLGEGLLKQKKNHEALEVQLKAIEINPRFGAAYYGLGLTFYLQEKYDQAVSSYLKAIEIDPELATSYNAIGAAFYKQNRFNEAITAARKALELNSDFTYAYNTLGDAFRGQKKLNEAINAYRKGLTLSNQFGYPSNAHTMIYYGLGEVLKEQKNLDGAIASYRKAIELDSEFAPPIASLGETYYLQKRNSEALEQLDRAIELDPNLKWVIELRDKIQKTAP